MLPERTALGYPAGSVAILRSIPPTAGGSGDGMDQSRFPIRPVRGPRWWLRPSNRITGGSKGYEVPTIGIDLAKSVFQPHRVDGKGRTLPADAGEGATVLWRICRVLSTLWPEAESKLFRCARPVPVRVLIGNQNRNSG